MYPISTQGGILFYLYFTNMLRAIQGKSNSFLGFKLVSLARPPLGRVLFLWAFTLLVGPEVRELMSGYGLDPSPDISPQDWYDALVFMAIFTCLFDLHRADSYSLADPCFGICRRRLVLQGADAEFCFKESMPTCASPLPYF